MNKIKDLKTMTNFDSHILNPNDVYATEINLNIYSEPDLNLILMASVYSIEKLQKTIPNTNEINTIIKRINSEINEIKIKHDTKTLTAHEVTLLMQVVTKLKEYHDSNHGAKGKIFEAQELSKIFPNVAQDLMKTTSETL